MWVLFAILTVIFWGTSEAIFKKSTAEDEHSIIHLLAYNGIMFGTCGFIFMLIVHKGLHFDVMNLISYLPIALVYILSMASYYHAMKRVKISIVSPIVNSSCALTVVLCVFILKQQLTWLQILAIVTIIFSIIMLSMNKKADDDVEEVEKKKKPAKTVYILGIIFAIGYFILDGTASFLDDYILEMDMTAEDAIISHSLIVLVMGLLLYAYLKFKDKRYKFSLDKLKLGGSVLETAGEFTFLYALEWGNASVVSPFVAGYSVVTLILSRIFLKEKLKKWQYLFILLILAGIIMLSLEE